MNFEYSEKSKDLQKQVSAFMTQHIYPVEKEINTFHRQNLWQEHPELDDLKENAIAAGLWNLFLPKSYGDLSVFCTRYRQYGSTGKIW